MKNWKKPALIVGIIVVLLAIVGFTVQQSRKGVVTVQTGKVIREDLTSVVTASGEIRPKVYVNIGANAMGKITHLYVKEGDRVKRGAVLAQLDNIQPAADVAAMQSAYNASQTDAIASQAAVNTAAAELNQAEAEYERAKLDLHRNQALYNDAAHCEIRLRHQEGGFRYRDGSGGRPRRNWRRPKQTWIPRRCTSNRMPPHCGEPADVLSKTEYQAPFDGVITNLPVREGETVVMGIQNAPGSTLMTIADTSIITAEVKVDESDIVNVRLGQPAEVTIDAIPKQKFKGVVTEIGRNALLRSTGVSTAQTHAQRAGSQGLQGRGGVAGSAAEFAAGIVGDGAHHHGQARQRSGDSDSGADHPAAKANWSRRRRTRARRCRLRLLRAPTPRKSSRACSFSGTRRTQCSYRWRPASAARPTSK